MYSDNDICLWCQDSLSGPGGPVMELTTEEFKLMFKHDATCKIIHRACHLDYQQKRANQQTDEPMQTAEQPDPLDQRPERIRVRLQYVRYQQNIRVRMRRVQSTTTIWMPEFCTSNRGPTMQEFYNHNSGTVPSFPRITVPASRTFPFASQLSQPVNAGYVPFPRALSPEPLHLAPTVPVQFAPRPFLPSFEPIGPPLQLAPSLHNRFVPYSNSLGYFTAPLNANHVAENQRHFHVQQNGYRCGYTVTSQSSSIGYSRGGVSVVTHTHSRAGY